MSRHYKPVMGLEVHIEQSSKSKLFCGCSAEHFLEKPNSQVCPVCLGLPGAMPYINRVAIENTVLFGLALGCKIANFSKFDRKHYFYPDLPKGYQISQYDMPLCEGGEYELSGKKKISITRIHLEEDTGKLIHKVVEGKRVSLVDFNRCSVPLMELVTEPDFETIEEVTEFLQEIQRIVRYLGISTADMEKGSMRLEANVSLREIRNSKFEIPNYKVELKNINSFKFLKKALEAEFERQEKLLIAGKKIPQETRGYDEKMRITVSQRSKEEAQDYKYFPEPDIPPITITDSQLLALKKAIPELPHKKRERFIKKYDLSEEYARILTLDRQRADYFEEAVKLGKKRKIEVKTISSLMVNQNLDSEYEQVASFIKHLVKTTQRDYASVGEVEEAIKKVLSENKKAVNDYKSGKTQVVGFLIGQVQAQLKGRGEPKEISKILIAKLQEN